MEHDELVGALLTLRSRVADVRLPLETASAPVARADRTRVLDQLDDYLLPRLRDPGAPVLVVVGGSTGAGKSTVVNSLVGAEVSPSGVLRPTTRWPVLVHHPLDVRWFSSDRVLPSLSRADAAGEQGLAGARPGLRLVASEAVPVGLALLDAPDVDSVEEGNRILAAQLLGAADVWLFVTTAARYADAVPWELLADAAQRGTHLALVLDRVDVGAETAVGDHLQQMLADAGLASATVIVVPEVALEDGLLPEHAVGPIADFLTRTATDPAVRAAALAETWDGAVADVSRRALDLADAADEQRAADARLRSAVTAAYATASEQIAHATSDGTLLRGEVLARWQDVVGTSEWFRSLEQGVSRLRDRVVGFVRGRRPAEPALVEAVAHGLSAVIQDAAEDAAERAHSAWRHDPAGLALLDGLALSRASSDLRTRTAEQVRAWQGDVLALVETEGADKRTTARALSYGVNGLGAVLMVAVFASTGGITGAEIGIVGGSALLAQRLLEAVFGDDAVRRLTQEAHSRLAARTDALLDEESSRFTRQLDATGARGRDGDDLRASAAAVGSAMAARTAATAWGAGELPAGGSGHLRGTGAVGRAVAVPDREEPERPRWWSRWFRGDG
ncbi:ABC transporter [Cellulomonas humilata]|uniref:ABC transporter n=2 Tax=Cellulomonas TaxID=1707 RepID=A0A7Y6DYI2_9CELL|nr:dynamin family protein [Cellulomonas humilata]NUU18668.1 ABC transporter [Cellulomonas humilata]